MKTIMLATALALGLAGSATAAPLSQTGSVQITDNANLVLVRDRGHHSSRGRHYGPRRHYGTPQRYRNWHRYSSRPYDWRTRRCTMVGPVWFCP